MQLLSYSISTVIVLSLCVTISLSSEIKSIQELNPGPSDTETTNYILPKLASKYSKYVDESAVGSEFSDPNGERSEWDDYVYDPKLFLLTESAQELPPKYYFTDPRGKREAMIGEMGMGSWKSKGPSLSIVNPLDVLRQRLLLEIARRKHEKSQSQIHENRKILTSIGKRNHYYKRFGYDRDAQQFFDNAVNSLELNPAYGKWSYQISPEYNKIHKKYRT